jgi:hypothetical protein
MSYVAEGRDLPDQGDGVWRYYVRRKYNGEDWQPWQFMAITEDCRAWRYPKQWGWLGFGY